MKYIFFYCIALLPFFNATYASSPAQKSHDMELQLNNCRQECSLAAIRVSTAYAICYNQKFSSTNNTDPYCLQRYHNCLAQCAHKYMPKAAPSLKPPQPKKSRYFMELYP